MTPDQVRVLARVRVIAEGCWIWTGSKSTAGYGRMRRSSDKAGAAAHRVSYEAFIGPIPDGLVIDHLCRTPICVNPTHLEPVTLLENLRRGNSPAFVNARRTSCSKGHPYTPENTYWRSATARGCARCCADRRARRQAARKAAL